jgi:subtilisin family serine protease
VTNGEMPSAVPEELAQAILDCLDEKARVLNVSAAIAQPVTKSERALEEALGQAARSGVIVIAAAGNQGTLGSTAITRHSWVIPVVAYDQQGKPMNHSNLGHSIGRRGLGAPGDGITSLGAEGKPLTLGGTSAAAPFVTGTVALLWSEFPNASAAEIKLAVTQPYSTTAEHGGSSPARCLDVVSVTTNGNRKEKISMNKKDTDKAQTSHPPQRIRLPGFVTDEDIGLGDAIKRVTYAFGMKPCSGCERRAAALNRWFVFTGRSR